MGVGVGGIVSRLRSVLRPRARLAVRAGQVPDPRFHRAVLVQDEHGKYSTVQIRNLVVHTSRPVRDCVVRLDDLAQGGRTCAGFAPATLCWAGQEGPRSDVKSFEGAAAVLLLARPTLGTEWELQTPAARPRYPLGTYTIELSVRGQGARPVAHLQATLTVSLDDARVAWRRRG